MIGLDLAPFFADFGETQSWTPAAGGASTDFTGIFEGEYQEIDVAGRVSSAKVAIICKSTDASGISQGDTVTATSALHAIIAAAYRVDHKEDSPPDLGPGLTRLVLKK